MAESEDTISDDESMYEYEGSEDNVISQGQNAQVDCSSEEDVDDETLLRSFKILRRITKSVSSNIGAAAGTRSKTRKSVGTSSKKQTEAGFSSNALSRCNHSYFKEIIQSLDEHRKNVVCAYGFGILLEFDGCSVPRPFVQWIAEHVDENCMDIHVSGKVIPVTPLSIHKVLGTHLGGPDIAETGESGKEDFLSLFEFHDIPSIKTFGSMILSKENMADDMFFRCFMVVALACFLCPNSNTKPSPKYFKPLVDLASVDGWDWSKFIFEWLVKSVKKYKKKRQTLGGCIYFLAVYYLDFLEFGANRQIAATIPRIRVWKGDMIKTFSSFDSLGRGSFGKRPVKNIDDTCYAVGAVGDEQLNNFRESLEERFGYLPPNVILGMCGLYEGFLMHHFRPPHYTPDKLILIIFQYLQDMNEQAGNTENPEENVNDAHPAVNDRSSENQNLGCGAPKEDVPEDDVATEKVESEDEDLGCGAAKEDAAEEDVVTEKVESDNGAVECGDGYGASQATATVIIESENSGTKDDISSPQKKKRKASACTPSPESSGSVASRTRRRLASRCIGKSPLCQTGTSSQHVAKGGSKESPLDVEDVQIETSNSYNNTETMKKVLGDVTTKRAKRGRPKKCIKDQGTPKSAIPAGTDRNKSTPTLNSRFPHLNKKAAASTCEQVISKTKSPFFNSPSVPPFRIFDDEDDLGNFIPDPSKRRPVGSTGLPASHRQKSTCQNSQRNDAATSGGRKSSDEHEDALYMESLPFTDETSQEFAKRRKSESASVNREGSSSPISPIGPEVPAVPLALETPDGKYIDLSQESQKDVTITGSKTFAEKCSELLNKSDTMYNWSFGSSENAAGSSSGKLPIYRARRFAPPSKYVSSPYVNERNRISVSTKEKEIYRVLQGLSYSNYSQKEIIDYKNVRVQFGVLANSLRPGGRVETYVVNALCKKIFDKRHARISLKHYFFTPIADFLLNNYDMGDDKKSSEKFCKAVNSFRGAHNASVLYNSKLLFFPMFYDNHWSVVVRIVEERKWVVLDPCIRDFGPTSAFHQHVKAVFLGNFMKVWKQTAKMDMGFRNEFVFADVPQSTSREDDGIYIMKFLEEWDPLADLKMKLDASDIPNLRIKYANEMVFHETNAAKEGIRILKTYDTEVYSKYFEGEE